MKAPTGKIVFPFRYRVLQIRTPDVGNWRPGIIVGNLQRRPASVVWRTAGSTELLTWGQLEYSTCRRFGHGLLTFDRAYLSTQIDLRSIRYLRPFSDSKLVAAHPAALILLVRLRTSTRVTQLHKICVVAIREHKHGPAMIYDQSSSCFLPSRLSQLLNWDSLSGLSCPGLRGYNVTTV